MVTDMSYLFCVRDDQIDSKDAPPPVDRLVRHRHQRLGHAPGDGREIMHHNNDETFAAARAVPARAAAQLGSTLQAPVAGAVCGAPLRRHGGRGIAG